MEPLIVLKDSDIFGDFDDSSVEYVDRTAVRVILLDGEDKIPLVGVRNLFIPGGGVEEGETLEEAAHRECLEETGCNIEIIREIGHTIEYRGKIGRKQTTHCFVAKLVGDKGEPQTEQEDEIDMNLEWFKLKDALELLKKEKKEVLKKYYHSNYNLRTHILFLEKYLKER